MPAPITQKVGNRDNLSDCERTELDGHEAIDDPRLGISVHFPRQTDANREP